MSRRVIVIIAALSLVMSFASVASSDEHLPDHPHIMLIGMEFDGTGEPIGFRKCVNLAGNQALPLHVHHDKLHFGKVGEKLAERGKNVTWVAPTAPFPGVPWTDCASFIEFIFSE